MSNQREQLNEMRNLRQMMEDIDNTCEQCGRTDCKCEPGTCECEPVNENKERPYVCHHNKKGEHECKADSSYGAAKKAAKHWGMDSTAGISATLTDVKQSTQFVGEEVGSKFRLAEIVGKAGLAELLSDLRTGGVDYLALYFEKLYFHFLDEYPDEIPVGHRTGRPDDPEEYVEDNLERYHKAEIEQYWNTPDMDESLSEGDPDDTDWDAHWAREDGDDERADDLEADAEFARMDKELDEGGGMYTYAVLHNKNPNGRLKRIDVTGLSDNKAQKIAQNFANKYNQLVTIEDWTAKRLTPGTSTMIMHRVEPSLDEVGDTSFDDYGATPVYEDAECDKCYGLGRKPSGGADCEACGGTGRCPKLDEEINLESIVEAVLGQPKDYYDLEYDDDGGIIQRNDSDEAEYTDTGGIIEPGDYERNKIDPEIEDEELGFRFD